MTSYIDGDFVYVHVFILHRYVAIYAWVYVYVCTYVYKAGHVFCNLVHTKLGSYVV